MRVTTETLSQVTNLLAIVSAPPIATTTMRHVEVLSLQPQVLMVVVITSTGGVSKRVFTFDRPVDPGLADWAAVVPQRAAGGHGRRLAHAPGQAQRPGAAADRARVHRGARAGVHRARGDRGEHALRRRRRAPAVRAPVPGRVAAQRAARRARAPRVAARRALARARRARHLRPDRRRERDAGAALAVAGGRQLRPAAAQSRHGVGDRADADGLRAGDRRPCARRRCSSPASSRTSTRRLRMPRDYYEVLGVPRDADEAQVKKAFRRLARELHPDVNAHDPDAEAKFKEAAEAYEVLSDPDRRQPYDTYGHEGLRSGGYAPNFGDFGSISDLFSAFFGAGGSSPRSAAAAARRAGPGRRHRGRGADHARGGGARQAGRGVLRRPHALRHPATATAPSRARRSRPARAATAPASSRPSPAPRSGRWSARRCATCAAATAASRATRARPAAATAWWSSCGACRSASRPGSPTASGSTCPRAATPASAAARTATSTWSCASPRTSASCATAATWSP